MTNEPLDATPQETDTPARRASAADTGRTLWRVLQQGLALLAPLILLVAWEALVRGDVRIGDWVLFRFDPVLDEVFFARPTQIWPELKQMYEDGALSSAVWTSTVRVIYGFVLGAVPAIFLGLLMGASPAIYALFQPLAEALYAIPKIAFLPLVIFLYGDGEQGMVRIIAFSVFFLVLLSVVKSVRQIDPKYREIARSFGAGPVQVFLSVILPASMPGIITSLQLGMGFALVVIVGAEFLSSDSGIGFVIWRARDLFLVVRYFAGLVVVGLMGYGFALILARAARLLLAWEPLPRRPQPTWLQQKLNVFWIAMRPWSFVATLVPILLGSAIAGYHRVALFGGSEQLLSLRPKLATGGYDWSFNWLIFGLALVGSLAFHAGTNLVNDYYDYRKGADNERSLGIGGTIQRGELSPPAVLLYGLVCFAVGSAIGLYLVSVAGPFVLYLGIFSLLAGFFYTAGPVALAYMGLGELTVGVFMGPVIVIGAYYVQAQTVTIEPLFASLPIAFLVAAILHANNLRDLENDQAVGKRTLATIVGRKYANVEYYSLIAASYVSLVLMVVAGYAPIYTLIALVTIPSALALIYRVAANTQPAALNPVLRRTAQLHMRFGLLLATGWFFGIIQAAYQAALLR
jgi:1,4-dihydroxy-2-naphthoate octaprenyltransferase